MNRKSFLARAALAATLLFTGASSFAQEPPSGDCWGVCPPSKIGGEEGREGLNPDGNPAPNAHTLGRRSQQWNEIHQNIQRKQKLRQCVKQKGVAGKDFCVEMWG